MKAKYDDFQIELSERYIAALEEVLKAEVEMMQQADPSWADCWYWGRAHVIDLSESSARFYFGAKQDMPKDGLGRFAVVVEEDQL